jgi:hypothetical protein
MNVTSSTGSALYVTPTSSTQSTSVSQVNGAADPDGDGDGGGGGGRVHKSHGGGGQVEQALLQALQSLGISVPQAGGASSTSAANSTATAGQTDSDGDNDGSSATGAGATGSSSSSVKNDLRQFMHSLFQALKSENGSDSSSATASTGSASGGGQQTGFAANLAALISQTSTGGAPADLQSAFAKLAADLQGGSGSSTSSDSTTTPVAASTTSTSSSAALQAFLTQLQQNLGYGSYALNASGNVISTQV